MAPGDQAIKGLESDGYQFQRHGGNHDVYYNSDLKCSFPVKRHQFTENALRYIRKEIKRNQMGGGE